MRGRRAGVFLEVLGVLYSPRNFPGDTRASLLPGRFSGGILIYLIDFSVEMPPIFSSQIFLARLSFSRVFRCTGAAPVCADPLRGASSTGPARPAERTVFHRRGDGRTEICRSCPPTQGQRRPSSGRPTALRPDHRRHHPRDRPSSGNRNQPRNPAWKRGWNGSGSGIGNGNRKGKGNSRRNTQYATIAICTRKPKSQYNKNRFLHQETKNWSRNESVPKPCTEKQH